MGRRLYGRSVLFTPSHAREGRLLHQNLGNAADSLEIQSASGSEPRALLKKNVGVAHNSNHTWPRHPTCSYSQRAQRSDIPSAKLGYRILGIAAMTSRA